MENNKHFIEFTISGVIKTTGLKKAEVSAELQAIVFEILENLDLDVMRIDTAFDIFSEDELSEAMLTANLKDIGEN